MTVYVYRDGVLVDRSTLCQEEKSGVAPHIISDTMDPLRHHGDRRIYDSKSAFRAATKASGCVEIGNDSSYLNPKPRKTNRTPDDRARRREAIRAALHTHFNR